MNANTLIGNGLKTLRIQNGYTLEYVGTKIGKTRKTIQLYEAGSINISVENLKVIVESIYGMKIGTFLNSVFDENTKGGN